jgi:hypothetical protein
LYTCRVLEAKQIGGQGTLESNPYIDGYLGSIIYYDDTSHLFRIDFGIEAAAPREMQTIQPGTAENDLIVRNPIVGPATIPDDTLRIRVWLDSLPFVYVAAFDILSGTCERS